MHYLAMGVALSSLALKLKKFSINYSGPEYVHIVARKAGFTTTFKVYGDRIEFQEESLFEHLRTVIPMKSISVIYSGYRKSILLMVMAILFLMGAILTLLPLIVSLIVLRRIEVGVFGSVIFSILLLIISRFFWKLYHRNKSLVISIVSNSGRPAAICFKRSEEDSIEESQAQDVVNIINQLLMQQVTSR